MSKSKKRIKALEGKVAELEARIAAMEAPVLAPYLATPDSAPLLTPGWQPMFTCTITEGDV